MASASCRKLLRALLPSTAAPTCSTAIWRASPCSAPTTSRCALALLAAPAHAELGRSAHSSRARSNLVQRAPHTQVEYDAEGAAMGVKVKDVVARTKIVVGDPSYFPKLCKKTGSVVRAIALDRKSVV